MFPSTSVIREGMIYIVTERDSESWKCMMVSSKVMDKVSSKPGKGICSSNIQFCILSYLLSFSASWVCVDLNCVIWGCVECCIRIQEVLKSVKKNPTSVWNSVVKLIPGPCFNRKFYGKYSACLQMGASSFPQHGSKAGFSSNYFKM